MLGTVINMGAVLFGSALGLLLRRWIRESQQNLVFVAIGVSTLAIGFSLMLQSDYIVYLVLSLVMGGLTGKALRVEERIEALGARLYRPVERLFPRMKSEYDPAKAFLHASVLFCSGSLAVIGPFNETFSASRSLLLVKSALDGSVAVFFAAAMGAAVMLSVVSIFLYQGFFALLGTFAQGNLSEAFSQEISAVGGAMIVMIGIHLLRLREIKVGYFLPSFLFVVLFWFLHPFVERLGALIESW